MSETKRLMPAPGVKVRRPDGRHLASDGEPVEMSSYWQRRIEAGDVVEVRAPKSAAAAESNQADDGRNRKRG